MRVIVARCRRFVVAAAMLVAGLVVLQAAPAEAQGTICQNHKCRVYFCFQPPTGDPICIPKYIGCYVNYPSAPLCNCPFGGSTCAPHTDVLTGEPTDEQLMDEARDVCHELVRERMKADQSARLFDKKSSWATVAGPNRVGVTGFALAEGRAKEAPLDLGPAEDPGSEPLGRRFHCEAERDASGAWRPLLLTLADENK